MNRDNGLDRAQEIYDRQLPEDRKAECYDCEEKFSIEDLEEYNGHLYCEYCGESVEIEEEE